MNNQTSVLTDIDLDVVAGGSFITQMAAAGSSRRGNWLGRRGIFSERVPAHHRQNQKLQQQP